MIASALFGSLPCRATPGSTCSTSARPHANLQAFQHAQRQNHIQQPPGKLREAVVTQASRADAAAAAPPGEEQKARLASLGGVVTDAAVPEGHKGLHGFLYGEGGAEEHDSRGYVFRHGEDDGKELLPVGEYLAQRDGEKPIGVYAVYDAWEHLQYVGYSRNIVLAVKGHLEGVGEERCAFVSPMVFANRAMATRANLEREAQNWLDEAGTPPPGNGEEAHLWGSGGLNGAVMSEAERAAYEEKKLKMRKAMGENLGDDVEGESISMKQRRLNLIQAVEGDDWSSVIDAQTAETAPAGSPAAAAQAGDTADAAAAPAPPIESPFARASVHRTIGNAEAAPAVSMTVETVDRALEEVRPYLIADGGNVTVLDVVDGTVMLQLDGACGTCASSTATMKMGIERALRSAFGGALKGVQQVGAQDTSATLASVDAHLDMLRPAISNYGGSIVVRTLQGGVCTVKYDGPPPIAMGIKAAIKDKFPDIKQVEFAES